MTTSLHRVSPMLPGQYSVRRGGTVALACPCCGRTTILDYPYRVAQTGDVRPAWLCEACNWSGELQLVDYAEEVVT